MVNIIAVAEPPWYGSPRTFDCSPSLSLPPFSISPSPSHLNPIYGRTDSINISRRRARNFEVMLVLIRHSPLVNVPRRLRAQRLLPSVHSKFNIYIYYQVQCRLKTLDITYILFSV